MNNKKQSPKSPFPAFARNLQDSFWRMIPPISAVMLAPTLQQQFNIPQYATYAVGFSIYVVQFILRGREVWRQSAREKEELQGRFTAEDAAIFDAKKNRK